MRPDTPIVYQGVDSFKGAGSKGCVIFVKRFYLATTTPILRIIPIYPEDSLFKGVTPIIPTLRRADVKLGQRKKVPGVDKRLGIAQQTYHRWRQQYGVVAPEMAKEPKALQKKNTPLKQLLGRPGLGQRHLERGRARGWLSCVTPILLLRLVLKAG
jgi:putative transposase